MKFYVAINCVSKNFVFSLFFLPCVIFANSNYSKSIVIDDINVTSSKRSGTIGATTINNNFIKGVPTATNTISDLLRGKSYIQFDQTSRNSATGGEITPPKISIRGSNHYENSFLLNGVSNNDNLNPAGISLSTAATGNPPSGEAQTLFIDTSLVDSVVVYTENVPAQHGGFTGGVVDAKLKDAKTDRWHVMMNFRYTKDDWTKFHWNEKEEKDLNTTTEAKLQPNFTKSEFSLSLDGPLSDNLGLMVSYSRKNSKIPLWSNYYIQDENGILNTRERKNQYRKNENFLFKFNTVGYEDFKVSLTGIYAPYKQEMSTPNIKNSDFYLKGGGYTAILDVENTLSFGTLKNTLNFQRSDLSWISDSNKIYTWHHKEDGYANWKMVFGKNAGEGGFGDYKQNKMNIGYKGAIDFNKFNTASLEHSIKVGAELEYIRANSKRGGFTTFNPGQTMDITAVGEKENGIITGEQYTKNKMEGIGQNRMVDLYSAALFVEDKIEFDRFKFIPGLRVSTDSITDNVDVAWRLFANVDIFNNDLLNVYGGYNRYYGTSILSHALLVPRTLQKYKRDSWSAPWVEDGTPADAVLNNLGDLNTPYSDELSIGTSIDAFDTLFEIDFVKREYKDQLRTKRLKNSSGKEYRVFANSGKSDYWGLTLALSKDFDFGVAGKHFTKLSATRSSRKTNVYDFNDGAFGVTSVNYVIYNGVMTPKEDLPAFNFNSPWVIAYTHEANINKYVKLYGVARYNVGGKGLNRMSGFGPVAPDGLKTDKYELKEYRDTFNIDLSAQLNFKIKGNRLVFGVDILNLMNRKNESAVATGNLATSSGSYSMGRQFYANFKYEF